MSTVRIEADNQWSDTGIFSVATDTYLDKADYHFDKIAVTEKRFVYTKTSFVGEYLEVKIEERHNILFGFVPNKGWKVDKRYRFTINDEDLV